MKVTPPLTLKALASRIHGQLPLNARESDKLLGLLKISFRNQLDKVHPIHHGPSSPPSTAIQRTPQSAFLSATRNIDAMINNPLLSHKPRGNTAKQPDITAQFLESIVYGTATLDGAKKYLAGVGLARGKAGPGMIVLDWLRSTALDRSEEFLRDVNLAKLLAVALTKENKHKLLMEELLLESKIDKDNKQDFKHGQEWRYRQYWKHQIVSCIINTSIQRSDHPEVTINYFLEIVAACREAKLQHTTFLTTTAEQIGLMTVARRHEISASIYDDVMSSCTPLIPPRHRASAMLPLYHPSVADAGPTLLFLKRLERDTRLALLTTKEGNANITLSQRWLQEDVLSMCLDSAPLIAKQSSGDSAWVLDFAMRHFRRAQVNSKQEVNPRSRTTQDLEESQEARSRHEIHSDTKGFAFG